MVEYVAEICTKVYREGSCIPITILYSTCPVPHGRLLSVYDSQSRSFHLEPFADAIGLRVSCLLSSWLPLGYRCEVSVSARLPFPHPSTASCSEKSIVHDIVAQLLGYCITKIN